MSGDQGEEESRASAGAPPASGHLSAMKDVHEEGATAEVCTPSSPQRFVLKQESATDSADTSICATPEVCTPSSSGPFILKQESATDSADTPILRSLSQSVQYSDTLNRNKKEDVRYSLESSAYHDRLHSLQPRPVTSTRTSSTPSSMKWKGIVNHHEFMPFASPSCNREPLRPLPGIEERSNELQDLLCKHTDNPNQWLRQAKQFLWADRVPKEVNEESEIEHVALCLKGAVWKQYKIAENSPERRDLFWVLDPSLPPRLPSRSRRQKAKPTSLNIFSFRALFGAVLHDVGQEAAKQSVQGLFPIHIAAEKLHPDAVVYLLQWGVDVNLQSLSARKTALHYAVRFRQQGEDKRKQQTALVKVLNEFSACHNVKDTKGHVPLFNAIWTGDIDLVELLIDHAPNLVELLNHADVDGDTHLHVAADVSSEKILRFLISKGANPMQRNHDGLTPSHIAAQKSLTCLKGMNEASREKGIDLVGTFSEEDTSGNTPLDYAAIHSHEDTFRYMWKCIEESPSQNIASYKPVLDRLYGERPEDIQLTTLQQTLKMLPKPMIQSLLTVDNCDSSSDEENDCDNSHSIGEQLSAQSQQTGNQSQLCQSSSLYNLLKSKDDACIPVVNTVLDKCLYGEEVIVSKVLDSGPDGEYPPTSNHDAVLRKFVSSHCAIWDHPTMRIWINGKWNQFGNYIVWLYAYLYLLQMLVLTIALCLAARPGVTDETLNYYNTPLDQFRGFMEGVVILMWIVKIGNELQKLICLRRAMYFRDHYVYVNIAAITLLALTFILRGVQSNIQWLFAALAYLIYSMLALEYLSLLQWSSTYIYTLIRIVKQDISRFFAVFVVFLVGFAGAFLLVLQVDRDNPRVVQAGGGMASASGGDGADNSTVYVWTTFYLGLRLLVEARSVLDYNGNVGWLAVLFYLAFLMVTTLILLNMLIAQMSDTYATVRSNARALAIFHRARFLLRYLAVYERWRTIRRKNQDDDRDAIVWSGQDTCCSRVSAFGCHCAAFKVLKKFVQYLCCSFLGDRIAARVESTDSEQEAMTTHNMRKMMENLKRTLKSDLKELRRGIRAVQAESSSGSN